MLTKRCSWAKGVLKRALYQSKIFNEGLEYLASDSYRELVEYSVTVMRQTYRSSVKEPLKKDENFEE